jgi:hypothetical protein
MKLPGNNKSKLNLSIDAVMFILLLTMAGIGFIMKYVVVPGEIRNVKYGNNVDLEFLGLTHHQWGTVHLLISICFLALIALHIIFHWKCIVAAFKSMIPSSAIRYIITFAIVFFGLIFLISPFFLEPEMVAFEPKYRNSNYSSSSLRNTPETTTNVKRQQDQEHSEYEVYGYHTVQYVADRYNIPVTVLLRDLDIPQNQSGERLSMLRRRYGITMNDVRKSISDYFENYK